MSKSAAGERLGSAMEELGGRIKSLVSELERTRGELERERSRVSGLEAAVAEFDSDAGDPAELVAEVSRLRERNRDLESRLARGRQAAERIQARVRFLAEGSQ